MTTLLYPDDDTLVVTYEFVGARLPQGVTCNIGFGDGSEGEVVVHGDVLLPIHTHSVPVTYDAANVNRNVSVYCYNLVSDASFTQNVAVALPLSDLTITASTHNIPVGEALNYTITGIGADSQVTLTIDFGDGDSFVQIYPTFQNLSVEKVYLTQRIYNATVTVQQEHVVYQDYLTEAVYVQVPIKPFQGSADNVMYPDPVGYEFDLSGMNDLTLTFTLMNGSNVSFYVGDTGPSWRR